MRFSIKLKAELGLIKDPIDARNRLVHIYINSTSLDVCAKLFDCDITDIINTLKEESVFEHKICSKCKLLKPFSEFYNNPSMGLKTNKCGISCQCRKCNSKNGKRYFQENKEKKYTYADQYRTTEAFKNQKQSYDKTYKSRPDIKLRTAEHANYRYHNDIQCRLRTVISTGIRNCLKFGKNHMSTENVLGYTIDDLRCHLESQFDEKMNWENYGIYWEIDHLLPVSYFQFSSYTDPGFKDCWNLENLQPLEKIENRKKSNKIDPI